jgi:hypothetical protein
VSAASDPQSDSLTLARRLLTHVPFGPDVELVVAGLPSSLARELPLPAGARLLGSVVRTWEGRRMALEAVFDSTGDPAAVLAAYGQQLQELAWEEFREGPGPPHGGFMPRRSLEGMILRRRGNGPVLRAAAARDRGTVDLRVTLDWEMARHAREWGARGQQPWGPMPALYPPEGITVRGRGGGGGGGHWEQLAVAETERAVAELEADFAAQLAAAGWTRKDGRADDTVAWSSWDLPDEGRWRGLLLVLAAFAAGQRSLLLAIESTDMDDAASGYAVAT